PTEVPVGVYVEHFLEGALPVVDEPRAEMREIEPLREPSGRDVEGLQMIPEIHAKRAIIVVVLGLPTTLVRVDAEGLHLARAGVVDRGADDRPEFGLEVVRFEVKEGDAHGR